MQRGIRRGLGTHRGGSSKSHGRTWQLPCWEQTREAENRDFRKNLLTVVHSSIVLDSEKVESTQMSVSRRMVNKMWPLHSTELRSSL